MNKKELVEKVAEKACVTKKDADAVVKALCDVVTDALKDGEAVQLSGFGTFGISERAERDGINPITKEKIHIDAAKKPKFKASKALKEAVK